MIKHLFSFYGEIHEINLEENTIRILGPYDPAETFDRLFDLIKNGQEFAREGG